MRVFIKNLGDAKGEAWVEFWDDSQNEFEIGSTAKLIFMGKDKCLIDTLDTPPKFRKRGYASAIVNELKKYFPEVAPIGVKPLAKGFWAKHGMQDVLGEEQ